MRRTVQCKPVLGVAPAILAGIVLVGTGDSVSAQAVAVGSGLATEGTGPLGLGALVGAVVAGAAALRERFKRG